MRILSKKKNHLLECLSSTLNFTKKSSTSSSLNSFRYRSPLHIPISNQWLNMAAAAAAKNNSSNHHHKLLVRSYSPTEDKNEFSLLSAHNSLATPLSLPPLPFDAAGLDIAPSCDGLLSIYNAFGLEAAIWNPSTMELKFLGPPDLERPPMTESTTTEFSSLGFDSKAQEYKVMRSVLTEDEYGHFWPGIESYSFKTGSWEPVSCKHYCYHIPSVYVDGCLYWDQGQFIVSIDFAEQKVSTFSRLHIGKHFKAFYEPRLVNFDGSLGCILCPKRGKRKTFEVWVRKGEGWRIEVNVHASDNMKLLGFWGNDQLLFLEAVDGNGGLLAYDCTMNQLERLDISFDPDNTDFIPFVESKLPLEEQLATGGKSLHAVSGNEEMGFIPYVRSMLTPEGQLATSSQN